MLRALITLIVVFNFSYRIYQKAKSDNKWSWPIFFGTLGGAAGMIAVFLIAVAAIFAAPRKDMGPSLLALGVAYVSLLIALIAYSNRAYKRLLVRRGLTANESAAC